MAANLIFPAALPDPSQVSMLQFEKNVVVGNHVF